MTEGFRSFGTPIGWQGMKDKLAQVMPGFQTRTSQDQLAAFMEKSITGDEISGAFCQAPTGTGKSLPLMQVLIDHALRTGTVALAATATKALQDQYIRDLEFLKTQVYDGGFEYALLKGRGNYVCRAKLAKEFDESLLGVKVDDVIEHASDPEVNGDVDRMNLEISPRARAAMTMSSNECPGKSHCKFGEVCFAEVAKRRASEAHVVVVNHAMVATDAVLQSSYGFGMLPNYSKIGVDEAHELAEYVANALTTEVTERSITNLVNDVCDWLERIGIPEAPPSCQGPVHEECSDPSCDLIRRTRPEPWRPTSSFTAQIPEGLEVVGRLYVKLRTVLQGEKQVVLTPAMVMELTEIIDMTKFLSKLSSQLAATRASGDDDVLKKIRLRKRVANAIETIQSVVLADFTDIVRWLELDEYFERGQKRGRGVVLCQAPLKVAEFMNNALWSRCQPLLVSATLATGGKFDYMAHEVGLDLTGREFTTFDCESPFDYPSQARTYIAGDIPNPRQSASGHRAGVNVAIQKLTEASQGRALHLFTSRQGMNDSFEGTYRVVEQMGYRVLRQGDMPTRKLAEAFKDDRHSVLYATKSFFTGVDVQGESLSLLTIDKAPFHVPTVVWKARCDAVDAEVAHLERWKAWSQGSFMKMMLPDMIITLMQAYGRLIRSITDKGLVAILDPALAPGGPKYGTTVRTALPPAPFVFTLAEAVAFAQTIPVTPDLAELPDLSELEEEVV